MATNPPFGTKESAEPARSGLDADALRRGVMDNLICLLGRHPAFSTPHDWYMALAYTVRDRMLERWAATVESYATRELRLACYLSAEFLIGPQLGHNLVNLGIEANTRAAMRSLGQDLDTLLAIEEEPGLGNWGARAAGRLLPGFACDARNSCYRVRNPLRVWHLQPGDP
ncbi:hypothetical protein R69746_08636 [Paraburkholderia aspalathi]|nr:hypothetical protein R75465_08183 [Paraburkholderia aspalathi]CAE6873900.1 hypothetical protein R69746_08636 [Paraburkholderia aspalathi]